MLNRRLLDGLRLLGDPLGMRILLTLQESGPMAIAEIVAVLRSPPARQPAVSVAVKKLREAGLLRSAREDRRVRYELDRESLKRLTGELEATFLIGELRPGPIEGER